MCFGWGTIFSTEGTEHSGYKNRTQFFAMGGVQNLTQRESPENKIGSSFFRCGRGTTPSKRTFVSCAGRIKYTNSPLVNGECALSVVQITECSVGLYLRVKTDLGLEFEVS